jgi:hypothetical protein
VLAWDPGVFEVEVVVLRMEDVEGYWRRPAAAAAFPATFEDEEPMVFVQFLEKAETS